MILGFDVETTIKEKGHVHHPDNFLVSYSFSNGTRTGFHYYKDPDFLDVVRSSLARCTELVGFNLKFDIQWLMQNGIEIPKHIQIFDVSLAEQILTAQQSPMVSFNEVLEGYGIQSKLDVVKGYWEQGISTEDIPVKILEEYNNDDAEKPLVVRQIQMSLLSPKQLQLVYQQGSDLLVLAKCELNGVKYNVEAAKDDHAKYQGLLLSTQELLDKYLPGGFDHGISFNWDSGDQLSCLLYGGVVTYDYTTSEDAVYQSGEKKGEAYVRNHWHEHRIEFPRRFDPLPKSEVLKTKGKEVETHIYQVDDPTLRQLKAWKNSENRKLLELLAQKAKYSTTVEKFESVFKTYDKYGWDGYLHGQYNQNVARTGRLSSSKPNMQNSDEIFDAFLESRYD